MYKQLYQNEKSEYDVEYEKRVDCEKDNKRPEGDNLHLTLQIETLQKRQVNTCTSETNA